MNSNIDEIIKYRDLTTKNINPIRNNTQIEYIKCFKRIYYSRCITANFKTTLRFAKASYGFSLKKLFISSSDDNEKQIIERYQRLKYFENFFQENTENSYKQIIEYFNKIKIKVIIPNSGEFNKRKGRVSRISKFPHNWRNEIINAIDTKISNAKEAVIALALSGCRPCELESIKLTLVDSDCIRISIQMAKVKGNIGLRYRSAVYSLKGPALGLLKLFDSDQSEIIPFSKIGIKQIANLLTRTSLKVYPKCKKAITPYCFRNAIASDAKHSNMSKEDLARLLGHTQSYTQKFYGRSKYGNSKSSWLPIHVENTHPVTLNNSIFQNIVQTEENSSDEKY